MGSQNGFDEIREHPWFKNVNWEAIYAKETKPEIYPEKKLKNKRDRIDMDDLLKPCGDHIYQTPNLKNLENWDYKRPGNAPLPNNCPTIIANYMPQNMQ